MKITATVAKTTEIELEVDDKFAPLATEEFWEKNEADALAEELIRVIEFSDRDIDKVYGIYNTNGDTMVEN